MFSRSELYYHGYTWIHHLSMNSVLPFGNDIQLSFLTDMFQVDYHHLITIILISWPGFRFLLRITIFPFTWSQGYLWLQFSLIDIIWPFHSHMTIQALTTDSWHIPHVTLEIWDTFRYNPTNIINLYISHVCTMHCLVVLLQLIPSHHWLIWRFISLIWNLI